MRQIYIDPERPINAYFKRIKLQRIQYYFYVKITTYNDMCVCVCMSVCVTPKKI